MISPAMLDAYARARAERPGIVVAQEEFVRHLSSLLEAAEPRPDISSLRLGDLYLACACAAGEERALEAFDDECIARVPEFVRAMRLSAAIVDEVKQRLRIKLLVAGSDGAAARILTYSGRGKLVSWVRVAAVRMALDLTDQGASPEQPAYDAAASGNPELDLLRLRHREEFDRAIRDAVARMPAREKALLRLKYVDDLNGAQIAAIYSVNRSTVSRWLADAHSQLLAAVRALLMQRVRLTAEETDSLARLLESLLDMSIGSLLQDP